MGEHSFVVSLHSQQVGLKFSHLRLNCTFVSTLNNVFYFNSLPPGCEFGQADMQKLVPKEERPSGTTASGSRRTGKDDSFLKLQLCF